MSTRQALVLHPEGESHKLRDRVSSLCDGSSRHKASCHPHFFMIQMSDSMNGCRTSRFSLSPVYLCACACSHAVTTRLVRDLTWCDLLCE